jgi:hypothetical protein
VFKKLFKKKAPQVPSTPEILGLRLGGAFELDRLRLKLIEPQLIFEGATTTQLIQAVGQVHLDGSSTLLRYYTDDDSFIQVVLTGGMTENHVEDVKLWYFYETKSVGNAKDWDSLIDSGISKPEFSLEGHRFQRVWASVGDASPPVAMTEKTYSESGDVTETDQFVMLYERPVDDGLEEFLLVSGEERIIDDRADRCLVISTGITLRPADITIIG